MTHRHAVEDEDDECFLLRNLFVAVKISLKSYKCGFSGKELRRLERELWLETDDFHESLL